MPKPHRWFRFSLRTLLLFGVTTCCVSAGFAMQAKWTHDRRAAMVWLQTRWASGCKYAVDPARNLPWILRLLGEQSLEVIYIVSTPDEHQKKIPWLRRLFPEAEIVEDPIRYVRDEDNIVNYKGYVSGSEYYDILLPSGRKTNNWLVNCVFYQAFKDAGKQSIPSLIELLGSDVEYLRVGAYDVLQQKAGRYDERSHSNDPKERQEALKDWNAWWGRNKDNPRLDARPNRVYAAADWELQRVAH